MAVGWRLRLAALALASQGTAHALLVGGGGAAAVECLAVLDAPANYRPERPRHVRCTDGDPACDAGGAVDGVCEVPVAVCANTALDPRCVYFGVQRVEVEHAIDDGDPGFDPDFQALQSRIDNQLAPPTDLAACTAPATIRVPIRGPLGPVCGRGQKRLRIVTTSTPSATSPPRTDKDKMKLVCEPAPSVGCDPPALFSGTFDRIQRQVLNATCAVSGCHDSETLAGGMTLEEGTAWTALVGAAPANAAAAEAGWFRVTSGNPAASFLYRKLAGDLPGAAYGERMPRGRRRLDPFALEMIELWIAAGAPETGWVAGTD